jgi:hypothetical protein
VKEAQANLFQETTQGLASDPYNQHHRIHLHQLVVDAKQSVDKGQVKPHRNSSMRQHVYKYIDNEYYTIINQQISKCIF